MTVITQNSISWLGKSVAGVAHYYQYYSTEEKDPRILQDIDYILGQQGVRPGSYPSVVCQPY